MVLIHPIRTAQSWMRLNKLLLIVNTDINIYSLVSVCVYNVSSQLSGVPSGVHQQCITVHVCSFPDRNPVVRSWIWTRCHVTWGWRVPWQGTISWPSGTSRSNTAALRRAGSALAPAPASSSYSLLACLQNSLNLEMQSVPDMLLHPSIPVTAGGIVNGPHHHSCKSVVSVIPIFKSAIESHSDGI